MTSFIEYFPKLIVIQSRGWLEYLTWGHWGRICSLDFTQMTIEETIVRPFSRQTIVLDVRAFDAVDYTYKLLHAGVRNDVEVDKDEFTVGLKYAGTGKVFPLAVFHGTTYDYRGFTYVLANLLPSFFWHKQENSHELASRSLANLLCQYTHLKLAY